MPDLLYPYDTLERDVTLTILGADIDGVSIEDSIDVNTRTLSLHSFGKARWGELTLKVVLSISEKDAARFAVDGKTLNAVLRAQCRSTSARQAMLLTVTGHCTWAGSMVLPFEAYANQINLEAFITVNDPERHIIGTAVPWGIYILASEKKPPVQFTSIIDCEYVSFSSAPEPYLNNAKARIAYIDLSRPKPMLWLNDDIPGLRAVLGDSLTRKGSSSDFRDALATSLDARMWHALIDYSIRSIEIPNEDDVPQMPGGWPGLVLNKVVSHLFPTHSREQALVELYEATRGAAADAEAMIASLDAAIDDFVQLSASLKPRLATSTKVEEVLHDAP